MKFDLKKYGIHAIAVVLFAAVSLFYCYPQLSGKKINQHDNISWQGMAREAIQYHDTTGKDVMWSNSMFGGMPTYATYVGATSTNYIGYVQYVLQAIGKPAYFFFIAMIGFYLLMCVMKMNKWLGMAGSIAYAFATYNVIIVGVGHDTKMLTLGYLPATLAGLMLIYDKKWLTGASILGVTLSLIFTNNHFQVIFYSFIMYACFGIGMLVWAIKEGKMQQFIIGSAIIIVTVLLGIGPNATSLLTIQEYSKETMRGGASELSGHDKKANGGLDKEYAFRWSNGIGETFCILIPYLYGGSSMEPAEEAPKTSELTGGNAEQLPLYWGPQPFLGGPVYFGAIICFLFVLGLIVVNNIHKWWIVSASVICIVLSWGKNFDSVNYFLFDHIPMLNKFRTPSMVLVIPQFLFPLLGMMGIQEVIEKKDSNKKLWNDILLAGGITAGICLFLGLFGSMFFGFTGPEDARYQPELVKALKSDRALLAAKSGITSAVFILVTVLLLWAYLKKKLKLELMILGIGLFSFLDLYLVARNYLGEKNYQDPGEYDLVFTPREVDKMILKDKDPYYRVLDLSKDTYNDAVQAYFHKCIGGYHPAKMEIYQDLIDHQLGRKGYNEQVLNMLNTKYIIVGGKNGVQHVIPNPRANGNAWFVQEIKWVNSADEEMESLNAASIGDTAIVPNAFDSKRTAIIRNTFKSEIGNYTVATDSQAEIKLKQYGLNDLSFISKNSKDGLGVFSDIYYSKGWKAYIDGKETPIVKADYVLRAIKIPAGRHTIEFHFKPDTFYKGQKIAFISSILLILLCAGAVFQAFRRPKELN